MARKRFTFLHFTVRGFTPVSKLNSRGGATFLFFGRRHDDIIHTVENTNYFRKIRKEVSLWWRSMLLGDKGVALALPLARGLGAPLSRLVVNLLARVAHERIHACGRRAHLV